MTGKSDDWLQAGKIARQCLQYGMKLLKEGSLIREVCDKVEDKIISLGAKPAFPAQISLNNVAAHYCPSHDDETTLQKNDVAKIDIGVHVNGCIGDNAETVYHGRDEEIKRLIEASKAARDEAIKIAKPGTSLRKIGAVIEKEIVSRGFQPIRNLGGHGLRTYEIHTVPRIPNYDDGNESTLKKGQYIAIEPFASTGRGLITEGGDAEVMQLVAKKSVRSPITRKVLKEIETYQNLPFCARWLAKKFGAVKTGFALRELHSRQMLQLHPPLPEARKGAFISQSEHSVLVDDEPIILTKV